MKGGLQNCKGAKSECSLSTRIWKHPMTFTGKEVCDKQKKSSLNT